MMKLRISFRLFSVGLVLCGLTALALAINPQKASADICTVNGRDCYYGYFYGGYDGGPPANGTRWNVIGAPALLPVNNAGDLIGWISGYLGGCSNLNSQNQTGAAFIILTMLGAPPGTDKSQACARFGEWASIVTDYANAGLVNFNLFHNFNGINTRSTLTDVAYYPMNGAASSIVFYSPITGQPIYAIKKDCANPVGVLQALTRSFNLEPVINVSVNGGAPSGPAETGDTITFDFRVLNYSPLASSAVNCYARNVNHAGYYAHPNPNAPEGGGSAVGTPGCPNSFGPWANVSVGTETVTASANTTICRTFFVNPSTPGGGEVGYEVCVPVANKPYMRVYGGDVSVGGGLATAPDTCTNFATADIMSWNRGPVYGYAGAGAQYGVFALRTITDFASALGNIAGSAPAATGLTFANNSTDVWMGDYGGNFGSVSCITDYYSQKPTSLPNIGSLAPGTGTYESTASTTFPGGTLNAGDRWTIYVDGDLRITGNIAFNTAGWSIANMPFLKIVVRGNIYVSSAVTQLDGVYIAQRNGASGGTIYTCATGSPIAAPAPLANGSFYSACANKLTVNGAFIANSVEFLRTGGTLRNASTGETSTSGNISEVFNFSPAFWITQPAQTSGRVDNYDAITSLPPVL